MKKEKDKLKLLVESIVEEEIQEGVLGDVGKVIGGNIKKVATVVGANVGKLAAQTLATFTPFVTNREVTKIGQRANALKKQLVTKINADYQPALKRLTDALGAADMKFAMLLTNPGTFLVGTAGAVVAESGLRLLGALTAASPDLSAKFENLANGVSKLTDTSIGWSGQTRGGSGGGGGGFGGGIDSMGMDGGSDGGGMDESKKQLRETQDQSQPMTAASLDAAVQKIYADHPEIIEFIKKSKLVKELDRIPLTIIKQRFGEIEQAKSQEDLEKIIGAEDYKKLYDSVLASLMQNVKRPKDGFNKDEIISEIKTLYAKSYVEILQNLKEGSSIVADIDGFIKELLSKKF